MIALISDIHANLEALKAVLNSLKKEKVTEILCLGDIVGYGANPDSCIKLLRDGRILSLLGNHDYYSVCNESLAGFNLDALNSIIWTRKKISNKNKDWLKTLPFNIKIDLDNRRMLHFAHSNLLDYKSWAYISDVEAAKKNLLDSDFKFNFIGHTHRPVVYQLHNNNCFKLDFIQDKELFLDYDSKWLVNVGSVGQPRDGINEASFVCYNEANHSVCLKRVRYNIKRASKKILKSGLPEKNANRLFNGL